MISEDGNLKLIDFGLSKQVKLKTMKSIVGSPYYVAPEVLEEKYGVECDIWSLGVILYIMLSGYLPFGGDSPGEVFGKIKKGVYSFSQKEWKKVSPEAKDLISKMLEKNTKKRLTAAECLEHDWFEACENMKGKENDPLDINLLHNLKEYKSESMLKKAALSILVKTLTAKQIKHLKEAFLKIDTDHTGYIDASELAEAMKKSNMEVPASEIDKIIKEIDYKGNKQINYSEFIAATFSTKQILNDSKMMVLFKEFDVDNSGYITKENLVEAFEKLEKNITKAEIDEIISKHDLAKDGQISFKEFKIMMLGDDEVLDTASDVG